MLNVKLHGGAQRHMKKLAIIPLLIALLISGAERFAIKAPVIAKEVFKTTDEAVTTFTGKSTGEHMNDVAKDPRNAADLVDALQKSQEHSGQQNEQQKITVEERIQKEAAEFQEELYRSLE